MVRKVTLADLRDIAAEAIGKIDKVYAHWTAGHYGQPFTDYHILIDSDGSVYVTTDDFTDRKNHTWQRNGRAIGIGLMCAYGAIANEGRNADLGDEPPTLHQIEALAQVTAILSVELGLEITRENFLTHCEAALIDGYGPFSGDPETRWDLWYLPDYINDAKMKPGGDLWRGKAAFYKQWWQKGD